MNVTKQAQAELRYLARTLRGIIALEELLGEAGDIESLVAEHTGKLNALKAEHQTVSQRVDDLKAQAVAHEKKIAMDARDAAGAAQRTIAAADAVANSTLEAAQADAIRATSTATTQAAQIIADAREVEAEINGRIEQANAKLDELTQQIAAAAAEHQRVKDEHASFRQRIGA